MSVKANPLSIGQAEADLFMADAAIKIASSREGFAKTDTFLEMIGFKKADIRRGQP